MGPPFNDFYYAVVFSTAGHKQHRAAGPFSAPEEFLDQTGGYDAEAVHFFSLEIPPILRDAVEALPDNFSLVDFGCGDEQVLFALKAAGLIDRASRVIGIDISRRRVENFETNTGFPGLLSKNGDVPPNIADGTVDFVISTRVIEHVTDDAVFLGEIRRVLKPGGWAFITTVFKKRGAFYFRRTPDGRWVLDPTHVREYQSKEILLDTVLAAGFVIEKVHVSRLCPPIAHPIMRLIHHLLPVRNINSLFVDRPLFRWIEKMRIPIPGYRSIETLITRPCLQAEEIAVIERLVRSLRRVLYLAPTDSAIDFMESSDQ